VTRLGTRARGLLLRPPAAHPPAAARPQLELTGEGIATVTAEVWGSQVCPSPAHS